MLPRHLPSRLRLPQHQRRFNQHWAAAATANYAATIKNLTLTPETRVMYQGFTGKQATVNAVQNIQFGTNVVGGVTPGRWGKHLGLPLCGSVKEAAEVLKPDASAVFVPAPFVGAAVEEAIKAEIPLVVAVAEHVPAHDILRIHQMLQTQSKTRFIGANCPGILNPSSRCRVGFMPHSSFLPGSIGIVAKSGTLSYEAVASTTRYGLGQSCVIGMGGDWIAGTTLTEGVKFFLDDPKTEGIVVIGEVGGAVEMEVAELLQTSKTKKPVMGLIAGHNAVPGEVMGHAGAIRMPGDPSTHDKVTALQKAGVVMVEHPGQFGYGMLKLLNRSKPASFPVPGMGPGNFSTPSPSSRRAFSTSTRRLSSSPSSSSPVPGSHPDDSITITLDRTLRCPVISTTLSNVTTRTPISFSPPPPPPLSPTPLQSLTSSLLTHFLSTRSYSLTLPLTPTTLSLTNPASLLPHLTTLPDPATSPSHNPGTIYIPLPGHGVIGTLVNGAGLAMNTVDVLSAHSGPVANFLDTGGKATQESVTEALRRIVEDGRVKVVFVNIFGGLTDCGVIAEGVVAGVKELRLQERMPVVVRLRGTRELEGQQIIKDSGMGLVAFHELDGAVACLKRLVEAVPSEAGEEGDKTATTKADAMAPWWIPVLEVTGGKGEATVEGGDETFVDGIVEGVAEIIGEN